MIDNVQHIEHLLTEKISGRRVLVIGDMMLDRYLWGSVDRISPEAPIPVVKHTGTTENPGGAANVALNLASLGISVTLAGFVGCDEAGQRLTDILTGRGVDTEAVCRFESMPTIVKSRIIVQRNQMLRLDQEDSSELSDLVREELATGVVKHIERGVDAVVISDYAKGVVTERLVELVVEACRQETIPVIVDPKGMDFVKYRGATSITPNFKEFCAASCMHNDDEATMLRLAREMKESLGVDSVVITRGEKGITAVGDETVTVPAASREVFDVSGAGDTVVAVLAVAHIAGLNMEEALKLANLAAGVVIGKVGTVAISAAELVTAVYQSEAVISRDKLCDIEELFEKADIWHAGAMRIELVTGCPDNLRAKDVELLEETRGQCDRLIVLLDKASRDTEEPINELGRIIAALHCVDAVVVVGSGELDKTISRIKPEVVIRDGLQGNR